VGPRLCLSGECRFVAAKSSNLSLERLHQGQKLVNLSLCAVFGLSSFDLSRIHVRNKRNVVTLQSADFRLESLDVFNLCGLSLCNLIRHPHGEITIFLQKACVFNVEFVELRVTDFYFTRTLICMSTDISEISALETQLSNLGFKLRAP